MDVLPLAVPLNTPAVPGSNLAESFLTATDPALQALDFAALLAAGISPEPELVQTGTAPDSEHDRADSQRESDPASISTDVTSALLAAMPALVQPSAAAPAGDLPEASRSAPSADAQQSGDDGLQAVDHSAVASAAIAAPPAAIAAKLAARDGLDAATERPEMMPADAVHPAPGPEMREAAMSIVHESDSRTASRFELPEQASATAVTHATPHAHLPLSETTQRPPFQPTAVREVSAPVASPEFAHDFSQQVVWIADKDAQIAELRLNPPELGPIAVRLTVTGDEASAQFVSPHSEVRAAIESSLVRLRESMAQAGIELGEAFVSSESFRDDSAQSQSHGRSGGYGSGQNDSSPHPSGVRVLRRGLVDTFA